MAEVRPLVALTGRALAPRRVTGWADPAVALQTTYLEAVRRAGGQDATLEPWPLDEAAAGAVVGRFDALVLTGGDDVDPATYGHHRHERTYATNPVADHFEIALLHAALDVGIPVLAICRGLQVVNVAFGGTLDQHISDAPGLIGHGIPGADGAPQLHPVDLVPGSFLAQRLGATRLAACSSHHHQAVGDLGAGLVVSARASDGIVEGLDLPGAWLLAVQWHPEDTAAGDPAQQRPFDALLEAARG